MSTNLQAPRKIASAVKTITDYAEHYQGSDKIEEQKFANTLNEFLFNVHDLVSKNNKQLTANELEKALFSAIVDENIQSHKAAWSDDYAEDPYLEMKTKTSYGAIERGLDKLATLKFPKANGLGVGRLSAAIWDIAGNLDNKESPLVKEMDKLEQSLYRFTVSMNPSYPDAVAEEEQAMMDVLSMRTHGDQHYRIQEAVRGQMYGLETDVSYTSGMERRLYPEEMFAFLAKQITTPTDKMVLITEGMSIDEQLPSLSSLTGEKMSIQSDIPVGDKNTAYRVAKLMNELNDRMQSTPSSQFWPYKDNQLDTDDVDNLKEKVNYTTSSLNRMLACESEGYKREMNINYFNKDANYNNESQQLL